MTEKLKSLKADAYDMYMILQNAQARLAQLSKMIEAEINAINVKNRPAAAPHKEQKPNKPIKG